MSKKISLIILIGVVCLFLATLFLSQRSSSPDFSPLATPTPIKVPPTSFRKLFSSEIKKTTAQTIDQLPNRLQKTVQADGTIVYTFTSPLTSRANEIRVKDDTTVYERLLLPETSLSEGYSISYYKSVYGNPDREIQGSKFYDWFATTYVYAKEGFAFIGNPHTDEIYEFHQFLPMTVNDYLNIYGQDVMPGASPITEEVDTQKDKVLALIEKLPFYGKNFTITYDLSTNNMTVFFEQNTRQQGEAEFNEFLQQNGIEDRSWITNLNITSL